MPGRVDKSSTAFRFHKAELDKELKAIDRRLRKRLAEIEGATQSGLRKAAFAIKKRSLELTPVDTGALYKSAFIETLSDVAQSSTPKGINPVVLVGYDRNNEAPHAVFVHEIFERDGVFIRHDPPTQAKFLQTAVHELQNEIITIVAKEATKLMKRRGKS